MIDDERGRVPFALLGVLLLVGSAAMHAGLHPRPAPTKPAVDVTMDRVAAETRTALRAASVRAAERAAATPVLQRANTSAGRVLNASSPFRDALRVRIYHRTRQRLSRLTFRRGPVRASASLAKTPNASALRRAKREITVAAANDNATRLRVTVENVTVTARRGGRVVGRTERTLTVVVRSPILAVHEQVSRFDDRLDRGVSRPGFGRRLTARLYALTWARGYAQYGSGLVSNVVSNRHVEVLTNSALLAEQRRAFGRRDTHGRAAFRRAAAETAVTDLLKAGNIDGQWADVVFREGPNDATGPADPRLRGKAPAVPGPDDEVTVEVNRTAREAFASVAEGALAERLQSVYSAEARVFTDVDLSDGGDPRCRPPGPIGWRLNDSDRRTRFAVLGDHTADVDPSGDWHVLAEFGRRVRRDVTRTCTWKRRGETRTTTHSSTATGTVEVGIVGRHAQSSLAPERGIATVHQRGAGPFDGANLAGIARTATDRLVEARGGRDELAVRAVEGSLDRSPVTVRGEVPDGLRAWVLADLARVVPAIENVSVSVERGRIGTFEANPPAELAAALATRRGDLLGAPETYDSVAEKARFAARAAVLEETMARLQERGDARRTRSNAVDDVLGAIEAGSRGLLQHAQEAGLGGVEESTGTTTGVEISAVEGEPPYLTTTAVGPDAIESLPEGESVHPLAARNVNVFTLPHGDAAATLLDAFALEDRVSLETAARTLRAVDSAAELPADNDTVESKLDRQAETLHTAVATRVTDVREHHLRPALADAGIGSGSGERERILDRAFDRWARTGDRALALTNGSAADAIADEATDGNRTRRALVRARIERRLSAAAEETDTQVPRSTVDAATEIARRRIEGRIEGAVERAAARGADRLAAELDDRLARSLNRVPAGLPVSPVGPAWYATTNLWYVEVTGAYDRFAVRARTGHAGAHGGSLAYVRDGTNATLDYDDDGREETLGRADRVSVHAKTAVAIVVPPAPRGVGDKDGVMDETSAGWSNWTGVDPTNGSGRAVPPEWPGPGTE